jgi:hypothetical protein
LAVLSVCVGGEAARAVITFELSAAPSDPVLSGGLEFSNFRFKSVFGDVEAEDVQVTIDGGSVSFSGSDGPLAVSGRDKALFTLSYDVVASDLPIESVSLLLDSETEAGKFAGVFADKAIFGERERGPHHGRPWGDDRSAPRLGDFDWPDFGGHDRDRDHWKKRHGRHGDDDRWEKHGGRGHGGKSWGHGRGGRDDDDWDHDDDWGHDDDDCGSELERQLAKLSTFDISKRGRSLASRLQEAGFDPQEKLTIEESVLLLALGRHDEAVLYELKNEFTLVPEPGTALLLGLGLLGLARAGGGASDQPRRRKRSSK